MPDLRGYGDSSKPSTGYDKRTMARDVHELLVQLATPGWPWSAMIAAPGWPPGSPRTTGRWSTGWWCWTHLPEALISGREELWLRYFFREWSSDPQLLSAEECEVSLRAFRQPGAVLGACNDYRAAQQDVAQDEADAGMLIEAPTLALWGADFDAIGQAFDVLRVWRGMARDVRGVAVPQCRHLPHEERPDVVNRELLAFLDGWGGDSGVDD